MIYLIFYAATSPNYIVTCLRREDMTTARQHLVNGYPYLLADYDAGTIKAGKVDVQEGTNPLDYKYDAGSMVALSEAEKTLRDDFISQKLALATLVPRILEKIKREMNRFIANRLLTNAKITQAEYDAIIAYIGQD